MNSDVWVTLFLLLGLFVLLALWWFWKPMKYRYLDWKRNRRRKKLMRSK